MSAALARVRHRRFGVLRVLGVVAVMGLGARGAEAGGSKQTELFTLQGAGTTTAEFLSKTTANGGVNSPMTFFVEVPPNTASMRVSIFDQDIDEGTNEAAANRDRIRNTGNTSVRYRLLTPSGAVSATRTCSTAGGCGGDDAWSVLGGNPIANPTPGHWSVLVDMTSARTNGDDINAFGVRAVAGDGKELNVYVDGITEVGTNPSLTRSYTLYPYVVSHCSNSENDQDWDTDTGDAGQRGNGSVSLVDRSGTNRGTFVSTTAGGGALSGNSAWVRNAGAAFTTSNSATGYGIWSSAIDIGAFEVGGVPNGNYAVLWYGHSAAAANPPTSSAPTGYQRIYTSTGDGTGPTSAPALPYLEQYVRHRSGSPSLTPSPSFPVTARETITLKLVNPTASAITFLAGQTITSQVPAANVVYRGNTQVTAGFGSITGPALGGTGTVTWTPGTNVTLAAGGVALASYEVDVTATTSGQTIDVTGTPASNGTRTTFVDHTGDTTNTRARLSLGPLCQVSVRQGQATEALIARFDVSDEGGARVLRWTTASETRTVGFDVYRQDRPGVAPVRINDELLPGLLDAPEGGDYAFVDDGVAPSSSGQRYYLAEVDADGKREMHGPFVARPWRRPTPAGDFLGSRRFARAHRGADFFDGDPRVGNRTMLAKSRARTRPIQTLVATGAVRFGTEREGVYRVRTRDYASLLRVPPRNVTSLARTHNLVLRTGGVSVPYFTDVTGSELYFYAAGVDSNYTRERAYVLSVGRGLGMTRERLAPATVVGPTSVTSRVHVEEDRFAAVAVATDPEKDYWHWEYMVAGDSEFGTRTFDLPVSGLARAAAPGRLTVTLKGAAFSATPDSTAPGGHRVAVSVNGVLVGETTWSGLEEDVAKFDVPGGTLREGANRVDLHAFRDPGVAQSIVYVDAFDLAYEKTASVADGDLRFGRDGRASADATILGLPSPDLVMLDVGDPSRPKRLEGAALGQDMDGSFFASFRDAVARDVHVTTLERARTPESARPWTGRDALSVGSVDYVVVTSESLAPAAERLAAYRRTQDGLRTRVVTVDQIEDAFGTGIASPWSVRTFLASLGANGARAPKFVVLAGSGTYDYREIFGTKTNHVPPGLVPSMAGLAASDAAFLPVQAGGAAPTLIGRVPARTVDELDAFTDKLRRFEARAHDGRTLIVSDASREEADFGREGDVVAGAVPATRSVHRVRIEGREPSLARDEILSVWKSGPTFVGYVGHGGVDRFAAAPAFGTTDVGLLGDLTTTPIVAAMTCSSGRFEMPRVDALGTRLLVAERSGAVAAIMTSNLSTYGAATDLERLFYERAFAGEDARLGAVLDAAKRAFVDDGGDPKMIATYNLLGDPATRVRFGAPSVVTAASAPMGSTAEDTE
ncbi:MAG: C25 family cysteine peptidase [Polyangiaceae bacterium]